MQFSGKITEAELDEVRKMARSKMYWAKLAMRSWYGLLLFVAVSWATIMDLLGRAKPNWQSLGVIWVVILGILAWSVYRAKRARRRIFERLSNTLPDRVDFDTNGVKLDGPDGASSLLPWRSFKGWREGNHVLLLDKAQAGSFVIVPVGNLSEIDRQSVRQFLMSQMPGANQVLQPE